MEEIRLLTDGYFYWQNKREHPSDVVTTRLIGKRWLCGADPEAAVAVYDPDRVVRKDAVPEPLQATLFGKGGVQGLEGVRHQNRKAWFVANQSTPEQKSIVAEFQHSWSEALSGTDSLQVFSTAAEKLFDAATSWLECSPPSRYKAQRLTRDMIAMVDAIGSVGPRHLAGRLARKRAEKWARQVLLERAKARTHGASSPLDGLIGLEEPGGEPLSLRAASVELLNVTRPVTAVAWYVSFCGLALHNNPGLKDLLAERPQMIVPFCHEVRRFYPFAPFTAGRAIDAFELGGVVAQPGDMVAVDVYGMHHNPDFWSQPQVFDPERFCGARPEAYAPQGTGNMFTSHRCPGEDLTLQLMAAATTELVERSWTVPLQPLDVDKTRIPARLPTGLRIQLG